MRAILVEVLVEKNITSDEESKHRNLLKLHSVSSRSLETKAKVCAVILGGK